jgi:NAD(P)-dependent dehydrogenase (short-subunit alcohol dehydrogenase family)
MKTAVIIGAGGIATAVAVGLAEREHRTIHVLTRGASPAGDTLRAELTRLGVGGLDRRCDVTDWESIAAAAAGIPAPIDALIYTPGSRADVVRPPAELTQQIWHQAIDLYGGGLVGAVREFHGKFARGASVVALSGTSARRVVSGKHLAMGAGKAALQQSVRYLAHWLAPDGVRVNAICCGPVDTPTLRELMSPEEMQSLSQSIAGANLVGRIATAQDIASAVLLLCSDETRWIYGQTILADGGEELLRG